MKPGIYIGPAGQLVLLSKDCNSLIGRYDHEYAYGVLHHFNLFFIRGWDYLGPLDCSYKQYVELTGVETYADLLMVALKKAHAEAKKGILFSKKDKREFTKRLIESMRKDN